MLLRTYDFLVLALALVSLEWGFCFYLPARRSAKVTTSLSGFEEFQSGQHTYAFWSNPRDSLYDGNDFYSGRRRRRPASKSSQQGRRRGRGSYDEDPDFFDEEEEELSVRGGGTNDDDDDDEFMGNNGVVDSLRKFYEAIFFYGLEIPESTTPRRRRGGRRGGGRSKGAALRKSVTKKKNPFFTGSERAAEEYFNSLENGESSSNSEAGQRAPSSTPPRGVKPSRERERDAFALGMDATDRVLKQKQDMVEEDGDDNLDYDDFDLEDTAANEDSRAEDTLAYIEDRLEMLEDSLRRVEVSIIELRNRVEGGSASSIVKKDLRILENKREELLDNIEELKIKFVDVMSSE